MYQKGFSLVELLVALAIVMLFLYGAIVGTNVIYDKKAYFSAVRVVYLLYKARSEAVVRSSFVALEVKRDNGGYKFRFVVDGDGDGVRNNDLRRGVDKPLSQFFFMEGMGNVVGFYIPQECSIKDPVNDGYLETTDPINTGRGDFVSFSPVGTSSPASFYIAAPGCVLYSVRINHAGRIKIIKWNKKNSLWKRVY